MRSVRKILAVCVIALGVLASGVTAVAASPRLTIGTPTSPTVIAAVATISQIGLQTAAGDEVILSQPNVITNLLTLTRELPALVQDSVVQPGTYSELRFKISGGYVQVDDGQIYATSTTYAGLPAGATVGGTLQMPSLAQSGLKVDLPGGNVTVGTDSKLLLVDFDVSQAFGHLAGSSGSWIFGEVVQASNILFSGNLAVTVSLGSRITLPAIDGVQVTLADFDVQLTNSGGATKTVPLAVTADPSTFAANFDFLVPGSYAVDLVAPAGITFTTSPVLPAAVNVVGGQQTDVILVVTSATSI